MLKLAGQLAQVEQVDGSVDFSGFGSSCSRCSRCFLGGCGRQHSGLQYWSVLISIDQYSSVVVGSFRIARCRRGGGEFCLGIERSP